jgi:hypothetical protein
MPKRRRALLQAARRKMASGASGPTGPRGRPVLVVALDQDGPGLEPVASELVRLQAKRPSVKPVILVNALDTAALRRHGLAYETAVDRETWPTFGSSSSYDRYVQQRIAEMQEVYRPRRILVASPGTGLLAARKMRGGIGSKEHGT